MIARTIRNETEVFDALLFSWAIQNETEVFDASLIARTIRNETEVFDALFLSWAIQNETDFFDASLMYIQYELKLKSSMFFCLSGLYKINLKSSMLL